MSYFLKHVLYCFICILYTHISLYIYVKTDMDFFYIFFIISLIFFKKTGVCFRNCLIKSENKSIPVLFKKGGNVYHDTVIFIL